jgi:hypothetical protein
VVSSLVKEKNRVDKLGKPFLEAKPCRNNQPM